MSRSAILFRLILAAAAMGTALVVDRFQRTEATRTFRVGLAHPPGHSFTLGLERFAESLQRASDGRLEVRIYSAAQLGGEREMQEMLALGALDMSVTGLLNLYEPLFATFELPYLYEDRDHVLRVMQDLPDRDMAQSLIPHGVRLVGFFENGFRHITNSKRAVQSPADLRGLVIRTPENPAQFETFKALGAAPTPMNFAELYTALAQGVVDGQENPLQNIHSAHLYEVQSHLAMTGHIYNVAYVVIGEGTWQRLAKEDRKLLRDCLAEATRWQLDYMARRDVELEEELKRTGMQLTYPDADEFRMAVQAAYQAIYDQLGPQAAQLVRQIQDAR